VKKGKAKKAPTKSKSSVTSIRENLRISSLPYFIIFFESIFFLLLCNKYFQSSKSHKKKTPDEEKVPSSGNSNDSKNCFPNLLIL
jgi:hypothetical protein